VIIKNLIPSQMPSYKYNNLQN